MIRRATKSEWSHTSLVVHIWGQPYIVEMQSKGVELISYPEWINKWGYEYIEYLMPETTDGRVLAVRALAIVGKRTKYDYFTFLFRIPWKLATKDYKFKGEKKETKRMICSQLTGYLHSLPEWWKMTPDDQQKFLKRKWIQS